MVSESDEDEFNFSDSDTDISSDCSSLFSGGDSDSEQEMVFLIQPDEDYDEENDLEKLKSLDKKAYDNFVKVKQNIEEKNPNIIDILKLPIHIKDKTKLVELYEVFKQTHEPTLEWIEIRDLINKLQKKYIEEYKDYSKFSKKEHEKIEKIAEKLNFSNTKTSLKRSILTLNTTDQNKAIIYKKYCEWEDTLQDNHDFHKMKTWLTSAIQLPYDNIKQLPCQKNQFTKFLKKGS